MTIREEDRFIAQSKLLDKYGSHVQIAKSWLKGELTKDEELVAVHKRTVLYLYLTNILPRRPLVIGPAPWFQMSGNVLRKGPSGDAVAEYSKNSWLVRGEYYTSLRFQDRACVQFSDTNGAASQMMGPFKDLAVSDGVASAEDKPFAQLHPDSLLWHPYRVEGAWPNMTIQPVIRG